MDNKNNTNTITTKNTNSGFKGFFGSETIKLSETFANLTLVFVAFYGLLYAPQVSSIITCQQHRIDNSHPIYKYIFTFGIFYFVVVVVSKHEIDLPPIQKLINCLFYFIVFIIFNRLDSRLTMIVLGLVFLLYFIFLNKQYYYSLNQNTNIVSIKSIKSSSNNQTNASTSTTTNSATTAAFIQDHQYWITYDFPIRVRLFKVEPEQFYYMTLFNHIIIALIIIIIIFGFVNYVGLLKYTYHNKIDLYNIFIPDSNCVPLNYGLGFFQYILLAMNYDYYIKKFKPVKNV